MANKKYYHHGKNKAAKVDRSEQLASAQALYGEEKLSLTLKQLGIGDVTAKLLQANGIEAAKDLVIRTEKDMFKVQGLNKRVYLDVKKALERQGMAFRQEAQPDSEDSSEISETGNLNVQKAKKAPQNAPRQDKQNQPRGDKQNQPRADKQTSQKPAKGRGDDERRTSRFGLADRNDAPPTPQERGKKNSQRPSEPLPIELWHKIIKGGKWGFSDGFKTVIPPMYDEVFSFKEGLASVEIDGKCGFIDGENNVVIPLEYDLAMSFSEGLAMVARGEKCGYINKNNEVVIDFQYDAASPFEGGEAKVKKDGKWATLTPDGALTWI